jgi:hypothetical protein
MLALRVHAVCTACKINQRDKPERTVAHVRVCRVSKGGSEGRMAGGSRATVVFML